MGNHYNDIRNDYSRIPTDSRSYQINKKGRRKQLEDRFGKIVLRYLREPVIDHLSDSLFLEGIPLEDKLFCDFSFLASPAYKAFEGFLIQLREDLQLCPKGSTTNTAAPFQDDNVDEKMECIFQELEENTGKRLGTENEKMLKGHVKAIKGILTNYRHKAAHFDKKKYLSQIAARDLIGAICLSIKETVTLLKEAGII